MVRCSRLGLRSTWARPSVWYRATRWMRIEGYYTAPFQDSQRAGGKVNRSRVGVQVVTVYTHEGPLMEERSLHLLDYLAVVKRRQMVADRPVMLVAAGRRRARGDPAARVPGVHDPGGDVAEHGQRAGEVDARRISPSASARFRTSSSAGRCSSGSFATRVWRTESSMDSAIGAIRSRTEVSPAKTHRPGRTNRPRHLPRHLHRQRSRAHAADHQPLATVFIDQHSKIRETRAEDTAAFLATQLSRARTRLRARRGEAAAR